MSSSRGVAASWLMMKRGCTVVAASEDDELCAKLKTWDSELRTTSPSGRPFEDAASNRCHAVALDWSVREFGSTPFPKGPIPVFYPLVGLLDDEVERLVTRVTRV